MFKKGDKVVLKYDDQPENDTIVGKVSVVVEPPTTSCAPEWMVVEHDGERHCVRGTDCRKVN